MPTTPDPRPSIHPHTSAGMRAARAAAILTAAGLLLVPVACASADDAAEPPRTVAPASSGPPVSRAPTAPTPSPTTPIPTTGAPSPSPTATTAPPNGAHHALLSGILASHRGAGEFVGARIALRDRDGTVTEVAAGNPTVDPASGAVDVDVPWNIGSATKMFVAVVTLQLAEEGRLDLDAPIARYVPSLAGADRITTRQLLQHTSGLGEYLDQPAVQGDLGREWTPAELIAVAEAAGRLGEPGGPHHYSNTNYIVLGEIIERVTGRSWSDEVRTRIAEPLGLAHTDVITDERAPGYEVTGSGFLDVTDVTDPSVGGAAGAMQSTNRDLLRFATALADGTLLSPASRSAMEDFVPGSDLSQFGIVHGYGLGLEQYATGSITLRGHMGTGAIQSAFVGWDADRGTAVAVQMNTSLPGPQALMGLEALSALAEEG